MISAWVLSPRKNDTAAVPASSHRTALLSWRPSTATTLTRCVRTEFGPNPRRRTDASALDNPSAELFTHRSTSPS